METLPIGTIVKLKQTCLGNPSGTRGICYETYKLDEDGSSFIFENGEYCGFSVKEQELFLSVIKKIKLSYTFSHVIKLDQDFKKGLFKIMKD